MSESRPFQPKRLFKYRSMGGDLGRPTIENVILHNRLWWQSPRSFNDPFDASPVYRFDANLESRRKFIKGAAKRVMGQNRKARLKLSAGVVKRSQAENERILRESFDLFMESSAVSCFSSDVLQPLMWAHYADSHRGVCVEFEEQSDALFLAYPMEYSDERPIIDWLRERENTDQMFKKAVLTKASNWSYEQEHRMVDWRGEPGWRSFPSSALKSVTFGARTSPEDRLFVENLINRRRHAGEITLMQTRLHPQKYGLEIVPV